MQDRVIPDSWLGEYLRYTSPLQGAEAYQLWSGIAAISGAIERNIVMDRVFFQVVPNMYITLVGPPGKSGKSTAIGMSKSILSQIDNPPQFFASKLTPERLLEAMSEISTDGQKIYTTSSAFAYASELNVFLGKTKADADILKLLTDLYDAASSKKSDTWSYQTKGAGHFTLTKPCINILAGSTLSWLRSAIPIEVVGGGFVSRMIFVCSSGPRRPVAFPEDEVPADHADREAKLIHDLNIIRGLKGEISLTKTAKEWYTKWYNYQYELSLDEGDEIDFFSRWELHLLKVAILFSVAESNELIVKERHLKQAEMALEEIKKRMSGVVNVMTHAESELPTARILGFIERRKNITHRQLAQYASRYVKADGLKQIIETLEESGSIEVTMRKSGGREYRFVGRPSISNLDYLGEDGVESYDPSEEDLARQAQEELHQQESGSPQESGPPRENGSLEEEAVDEELVSLLSMLAGERSEEEDEL